MLSLFSQLNVMNVTQRLLTEFGCFMTHSSATLNPKEHLPILNISNYESKKTTCHSSREKTFLCDPE